MDADFAARHSQVLIIGDNHFLVKLVVTNLAPLAVDVIDLSECGNSAAPGADARCTCRVLLLALSQSNNEPVVILARTGLTHLVGTVPLLIISDRTFQADPERCIYHLPFPFRANALRQTVDHLLAGPASHRHCYVA